MFRTPPPPCLRRACGPLAAHTFLVLATAGTTLGSTAPQEATGFAALRAGRYDDAVRALRPQALDGNAAALSGWVTALRETGDHDGAVRAAERGVERNVPGARALLGAALMEVGRVADARAALQSGSGLRGPPGAAARVELGILEYRYGDRGTARDLFDGFIDYYNDARALSAAELTSVGRALVHLSRWDYEYAHDALRALDEAIAAELFLERYDARQAAEAFQAILAENPAHPGALLGLARVARLEGGGNATEAIEAALATNPALSGARTLLARLRLLGGSRDQALEEAERVLKLNAADLEALGTKAAILNLSGNDTGFRTVMAEIGSLTAFPTEPLIVLSELSADHLKYGDALAFARLEGADRPGRLLSTWDFARVPGDLPGSGRGRIRHGHRPGRSNDETRSGHLHGGHPGRAGQAAPDRRGDGRPVGPAAGGLHRGVASFEEADHQETEQEAKTMAQVMTEYERSLEAFGRKRWREGRAAERAAVLCRLAAGRFGAEAGERLAGLFGTPSDSGRLATAEAAILDCTTAAELLRRVESSPGA